VADGRRAQDVGADKVPLDPVAAAVVQVDAAAVVVVDGVAGIDRAAGETADRVVARPGVDEHAVAGVILDEPLLNEVADGGRPADVHAVAVVGLGGAVARGNPDVDRLSVARTADEVVGRVGNYDRVAVDVVNADVLEVKAPTR